MGSISMRWGEAADWARRIDWGSVATWLLGFTLVAYLGLEGGGYDPLVHDQVGIAVWWVVLVALLVGALPRRRLGLVAWLALGLLGALVAWTALGLTWTESDEKTMADLARVGGFLGIFALALFSRGRDDGRRLLAGVACGIVLVALVGLLSRLQPELFPEAGQTASFLTNNKERLSYPLNYWNGLAALIAVGLPAVLHLAGSARSLIVRGLFAAALPALLLAIYFTLSRGGLAAAAIALGVYLAIADDRLPRMATLGMAAGGGALLVVVAHSYDDLRDGALTAAAESQGGRVLLLTLLVCLIVGALQWALCRGLDRGRPSWTVIGRRQALRATAGGAALVLVALLLLGAPGRASDAWAEFKEPSDPGPGAGRLGSAAGQSRYQYWSVAVDEAAEKPLTGTGSGTFEYWWSREGENDDTVRDAHSLYMQTLGEMGVVGLLILVGFFVSVLAAGGTVASRAGPGQRGLAAAALAGCLAFMLSAAVDWVWQLPVLPAALLLLAAILVAPGSPKVPGPAPLRWPLRASLAGVAVAAIVVTAIPLASTSSLRESEADARAGDLVGALAAARSAVNAEPAAASPYLQEALVLEQLGRLDAAAAAAAAATERESTNWRTWFVLSRIEAQRGRAEAAVAAYREARSLNPLSPIFDA